MPKEHDPVPESRGESLFASLPALPERYWEEAASSRLADAPSTASMRLKDGEADIRLVDEEDAPPYTTTLERERLRLEMSSFPDAPLQGPGGLSMAGHDIVPSETPIPTVEETEPRGGEDRPNSVDEPEFELRQALGRGGQGEVWAATQSSLNRDVALKLRLGKTELLDFLVEAYTSAELEHPNILPVHDLRVIGSGPKARLALAMKLARGEPWNRAMEEDRRNPAWTLGDHLARHLRVLVSVCHAVAYAHSKGIIHRDIKPHQVVVGRFGEAWLLDWGMAVSLNAPAPMVPTTKAPKFWTLDSTPSCAGTPAYMAPEQAAQRDGGPRLGAHTDVYLLGATLYHIVAGRPPHAAQSGYLALRRAALNEIDAPPDDCPPELRDLLQRSLAADPKQRPATAADFRDEIEEFLQGVTRRRESVELGAKAERALAEADGAPEGAAPYARYEAVERDLDRALALWDRNEQASAAREKALEGHAERALALGDLALASGLANGLADPKRRRALAGRVAEEEAKRQKASRQRKQFAYALGALLLVYIVSVSGLFARSERARRLAEENERQAKTARAAADRQRGIAEERRQEAERNETRALDAETVAKEQRDLAEERREAAERALAAAKEQGATARELTLYVLDGLKEEIDDRLAGGESGLDPDRANELAHAIQGGVAKDIAERYRQVDVDAWPEELRLEHAEHLVDLAEVFDVFGAYGESFEFSSESLRLRSAILPDDDLAVADSLRVLGGAFWQRDQDLDGAMERLRRALAIRAARLPENHELMAQSRNNVGLVLLEAARYDEALPEFEGALARMRANPEANESFVATLLANLGACLRRLDRVDEAVELLRESLSIRERLLDEDDPLLAEAYGNLGAALLAKGSRQEAIDFFHRSRDAIRRRFPETHPLYATSLSNLASAYVEAGDFDEAARYDALANEAVEQAYGPNHPTAITQLGNSAVLMSRLNMDERAMEMFLLLRERVEKANPPLPERLAFADGNIAFMRYKAREYAEAARVFARASDEYDAAKGPASGDAAAMRRFLLVASTFWAERAEGEERDAALEFVRLAVEKWEARPNAERDGFTFGQHGRWARAMWQLGREQDARDYVVALAEAGYPAGENEPFASSFIALAERLGVDLGRGSASVGGDNPPESAEGE